MRKEFHPKKQTNLYKQTYIYTVAKQLQKHAQRKLHTNTNNCARTGSHKLRKIDQNCKCRKTRKPIAHATRRTRVCTRKGRGQTQQAHTHTNTLNKTLRHRRNRFPFPCDMNAKACRNMEEEQLDQQSRLARLQLLEGCRLAPTTMLGLGCRYVGCKLATYSNDRAMERRAACEQRGKAWVY